MRKKLLSIFLTITIICTMLSALSITASAATTRCGISANWQGTSSWPTSGGYYYLTSDFGISRLYTSIDSGDIYLDLNGHTITFTSTSSSTESGILLENGYDFYLYDSGSGGTLKMQSGAKYKRAVKIDNSGSYFYMYGGTITGFGISKNDGAGVLVNNGYFYMYGGTITSNNAGGTGGGVQVNSAGTFNMYKGTISSNNANRCGGGVHVSGGTFTMKGGSIESNKAKTSNGDNWIGGGGVYVTGGTFTMYDGSITSNTSNNRGGGVMLNEAGKFYMNGGTIRDNTSSLYGGGVFLRNTGKSTQFYVNGGTIGSNTATKGGSIISKSDSGTGTISYTSGRFYISDAYSSAVRPSTTTKYTVTLNQNGGTGGTSSLSLAWGNALTTPITKPTREGYTFNGYYNSNGEKYYNADGTRYVTYWDYVGNQTLTANYTANKYTVTLSNNGGTGGTASVSATYNSAMPSATMPTKTGYTFNGYFDAAEGGTKYYNADGTSARTWDKTSNTTLYAQWTANNYTVTLSNLEDAECEALSSYTYGKAETLPIPTKTSYTFGGWYVNADFTGEPVTTISDTETGDKVFYAKWTANGYSVTLNANGGTCDELTSYTYGVGATLPTPTKAGYNFAGWYDNADFEGDPVTEITTTDTGDKEFYAKWEIIAEIKDSSDTVEFPKVQSKITGDTAVMRFMWQVNFADGATVENIGAYIIPWDLFSKNSESLTGLSSGLVEYKNPEIQSGDTFSADLTDIPRMTGNYNIFENMQISAFPFINGKLLGNFITSTVNEANIDK